MYAHMSVNTHGPPRPQKSCEPIRVQILNTASQCLPEVLVVSRDASGEKKLIVDQRL